MFFLIVLSEKSASSSSSTNVSKLNRNSPDFDESEENPEIFAQTTEISSSSSSADQTDCGIVEPQNESANDPGKKLNFKNV